MKQPFFSILIPVYNVEKYLPICLDSVLRQSFDNYEVILVDDGSRDGGGQICDAYCEKHPDRITVYHKENQGLISARREGLKRAKGEYICFLDSDDCWSDHILLRLHEVITETNADVIMFDWVRMDEEGNILHTKKAPLFPQSGMIDQETAFRKMITTPGMNLLWAKCCRREVIDIDTDYSKYYSIQVGEDLLQSLPILYRTKSLYYLKEELYYYRTNLKSLTHRYNKNQHTSLATLRPLLYEYMVKMNMDTEENISLFFDTYIGSIWREINTLEASTCSRAEKEKILREMRSYEYVIKAKEFLDGCSLDSWGKRGMRIFYANRNAWLHVYTKTYQAVINSGRKVRDLIKRR